MNRRSFFRALAALTALWPLRKAKAEHVGHCLACQWWKAPDETKGPWGMCLRNSADNCLYELTPSQPYLFTLPGFGCVHWKAK